MEHLRKLTWGWCAVIAIAAWMAYSQVAGSVVTTLTCDRASDTCKLSGGTQRAVPGPSKIKAARLEGHWIHHEGEGWDIYLDDEAINPQIALDDHAHADYQRFVDAVNAWLKDPAQPRLVASFTYTASRGEKIQAIAILVGTIGVLVFLVVLGRRRADRG
jgi:hypothetical protein